MNRSFRLLTPLASLACVWLAVSATGCGKGVKFHPVEGKVLYQNQPLTNAVVTFYPESATANDVCPVGRVGADGTFTLTSLQDGDGAPEGDYRVAVVYYLADRTRPGTEGDEPTPRNYLPEIFSRPESTPLRATVGPGRNTLRPFELTAK